MRVTLHLVEAGMYGVPDKSVDLVVTSPPYYALRDYRDGATSLGGQIGSEPTPQAYLEALWECTTEWARVLKPDGSMFVVLVDKYSDRPRSRGHRHHERRRRRR